jgi:hypothetical protein
MLAIIEAVAMPPDDNGKQLIQLYSYQREDGGGTVRDANLALDIVNELTDPLDGEESPIIKGEPPRGKEYQPLWEIFITVAKTHKDISFQKADYRKFDGCPVCASEAMMDIYAAVKKALRKGLKGYRAMKAAKKKARAA